MKITSDDILKASMKSIYDLTVEAMHEATRNGIKANSIVINDNLVKVPESFGEYPEMICGLKTYRTSCELPEDYIFSVFHDPNREQKTVVQRWIPVTERLPEIQQRVLVYCESKTIEKHITSCTYMGGYLGSKQWSRHVRNVTHWMPLPEPPEDA